MYECLSHQSHNKVVFPTVSIDGPEVLRVVKSSEQYLVSPVKHGYFLPQDITTLGPAAAAAIGPRPSRYHTYHATVEAARPQVEEWQRQGLDAIEYIPMVLAASDIPHVVDIAKLVRDHGIDLWLTPRLLKHFYPFPEVPEQFRGKQLSETGEIVTAVKKCSNRPDLDFFNPQAVDWLFDCFQDLFLSCFAEDGYQGYRWPEVFHGHSLVGGEAGEGLIPWWQRPAYSDATLEQWREYCQEHNVEYEDKVVDRLPVADPTMMAAGDGKTAYYPGLAALPEIVTTEVPLSKWLRNTGVWAAWDAFRCQTYMNNYLLRWSRKMHQANASNPTWRGVEYLGSSGLILPYEQITDPTWRLHRPAGKAWGYQCGIDVEALGRAPEITHITHEFRGRVKDEHLEQRHDFCLSLINQRARQNHGLFVHCEYGRYRDPNREPLEENEEQERWQFIKNYQPHLLSMWSLAMLYPPMEACESIKIERFWQRLRAYQDTGDPFAAQC